MNLSAWQRKQRIRREADAFVIWREGSSVGWDCTISELADATGLAYGRVRKIVRARNWLVNSDPEGQSDGQSSLTAMFSPREEPRHAYA